MDNALAPHSSAARRLLEELTAISSPSGDVAGLAAYAEVLRGAFEQRGFRARVAVDSGRPVFFAHSSGAEEPAAHPLLLLSHLDTVLPAIPPRWQGDRLFATGAIDTKSGLASLLIAVDLLRAAGHAVPQDLLLVAVPDEEVSGEISHRLTREHGAAARAIWILEPGEPRGDAETLVAGRRGMFGWRLQVEGRSAHSGLHFWRGVSALDAAARFAVGARALSRPGAGPTVNPARLVAGDATFVDELASHAAMLGTGRQVNVIADRARVDGEARFLSRGEAGELEAALRRLSADIERESGATLVLTVDEGVAPVDPRGPQRALCARAVDLAERRGWRLEIEEDRGGISFSNFLADPARVPVLDGLAPAGGGMHTREENLDWRSFERRTLLLHDLLLAES
jgi:glutamate carboxypeptidase